MPMVLSLRMIEEIAAAVTRDFNHFFYGEETDLPDRYALPTPIDQLASDYLKLHVKFARLSSDGSILGLTAYTDTEYEVVENGKHMILPLLRNEIVLDSSFIKPGNIRRLCGKRRFTLAHECAHQILFQLEEEKVREAQKKKYSERSCHTPHTLKTREDWNEWQANALGAAILMPQAVVDHEMWFLTENKPLTRYGDLFYDRDRFCIEQFCAAFGVSKAAAAIRLEQMGYLIQRKVYEYQDPLEVVV